jgi:hypothetical protein
MLTTWSWIFSPLSTTHISGVVSSIDNFTDFCFSIFLDAIPRHYCQHYNEHFRLSRCNIFIFYEKLLRKIESRRIANVKQILFNVAKFNFEFLMDKLWHDLNLHSTETNWVKMIFFYNYCSICFCFKKKKVLSWNHKQDQNVNKIFGFSC